MFSSECRFSCSAMCVQTHELESIRSLRRQALGKRSPRGSEGVNEAEISSASEQSAIELRPANKRNIIWRHPRTRCIESYRNRTKQRKMEENNLRNVVNLSMGRIRSILWNLDLLADRQAAFPPLDEKCASIVTHVLNRIIVQRKVWCTRLLRHARTIHSFI